MQLNAAASTDWRNPVWESCAVSVALPDAQSDAQTVAEAAPIHNAVCSKQDAVEEAPATPSQAAQSPATPPLEQRAESKPPANLALAEARECAFKDFERIHGQPPTWDNSDYAALAKLFHDKPKLTSLEFHRRWLNFSSSTDPFETKQGMRLRYFCANFDKFMNGPILERKGGANGNAQRDGTDKRIFEWAKGDAGGVDASLRQTLSAAKAGN
jgi:hypothetical protein